MSWKICVALLALWLLGMVASYTMGGLIHILLVIAIVVMPEPGTYHSRAENPVGREIPASNSCVQ